MEIRVQALSSSGELQGQPHVAVRSSSIEEAALSGDGDFVAFVSADSFGDLNASEESFAVFSAPTDGFLSSDPEDQATLALAEVVEADSDDIDAMLGPTSVEDTPAFEGDPTADSSTADGSSSLNLDQMLVSVPDDVS